MTTPDSYQQLIAFLFDREESKGDWHFKNDPSPPELTDDEKVTHIKRLFESYGSDLAQFSDWQLGTGLNHLFNSAFDGEFAYVLSDGTTPLKQRLEAIQSIRALFDDCLEKRCQLVLSHLSQPVSKLNHFCYMLWNVSPIAWCEGDPEGPEIYRAIAEVI